MTVTGVVFIVVLLAALVGAALAINPSECSGSSSRLFLRTSNLIVLTVGGLMWAVVVVTFLVGNVSNTLVCETLRSPADSEFYFMLEYYLQDVSLDIPCEGPGCPPVDEDWTLDVAATIDNCKNNFGIYEALKLDRVFPVEDLLEWKTTYGVDSVMEEAAGLVNKDITSLVDQLSLDAPTKDKIKDMVGTFSSLNSTVLMQVDGLNDHFDNVSRVLGEFEKVLTDLSQKPPSNLADFSASLATLQGINLTQIAADFESLAEFSSAYNSKLQYMGSYTIVEAVQRLLELYDQSVLYLNATGRSKVLGLVDGAFYSVIEVVDYFAKYGVGFLKYHLGACRPLYNLYRSVTARACQAGIVGSVNGLWVGLGTILLFSLPLMITSCCLAQSSFRQGDQVPDGSGHRSRRLTVQDFEFAPQGHSEVGKGGGGTSYSNQGFEMRPVDHR